MERIEQKHNGNGQAHGIQVGIGQAEAVQRGIDQENDQCVEHGQQQQDERIQ